MNFFNRHKHTLIRFGTMPVLMLACLVSGFVLFRPKHVSPQMFWDYFSSSPLGMALEFIAVLTMLLYLIRYPQMLKYRAYFVAGAFFAGLVIDGLYITRLSQTIDFMSLSGISQFCACAASFYALYRLMLLLPERWRRGISALIVFALAVHLVFNGYSIYQRVASMDLCRAGESRDLWAVIIYKDPQSHCSSPQ